MRICRISVLPITRAFEGYPQRHFHIFTRLKSLGHQIEEVRIVPSLSPKSPYFSYPIGLLRAIPRLRSVWADLLLVDSMEAGLVGLMTSFAKRIPFVFDFRDNYSFLHRRDYGYRNFGSISLLERLLPRLADQVIAVDDRRRRSCIEAGVKKARVRLIPNGGDPDHFRPDTKDPRLLSNWALPGYRVILYCGKVNRTSQLENVVAAMQEVIRSHPDTVLLLVGDGTALLDLKRLTGTLGLEKAVVFAGFRPFDEIPGLIQASDICIYPLRSVAALSIFEYMACGKPVIVPNADYDLSLPEGSCLSVQKTPAGFAGGIIRLLEDRELALRLGHKAREIVEHHFNWDQLSLLYEAALKDAVKGRLRRQK